MSKIRETYTAPFELKSVDDDKGIIEGYASIFDQEKDSYGDIVVQRSFAKSIARGGRNRTGWPMLWNHNHNEPIGKLSHIEEESKGLFIQGVLTRAVQKADEVYHLVKERVIQALSFGYSIIEEEYDKETDTRYLKELDLWEVSPVTFPAKVSALITNLKSEIDAATTVRDIESILKMNGLSGKESKMIISKIKSFNNDIRAKNYLSDMLIELRKYNIGMESKKVIPFRSFSLSTSSWDGPGEVKKAGVDNLKIMCTWYDSSNSGVKASYKLPHHKATGYATVWKGVTAAMAALLGARGGVQIPTSDRKGVYNHLSKHYAEFEKEPPKFKEYSEEALKKIETEEINATYN